MRPVQQLYYEGGQLHCPIHGSKYIRFATGETNYDSLSQKIDWCCTAVLPDGSNCLHCAAWESIYDMHDLDLEQLAAAYQQQNFGS